jgi:hypothetical protein
MTAEQASAELRSLMHDDDKKWSCAYAMGAGCTTEDNNEISVAIRRRDADLRAVIVEHREGFVRMMMLATVPRRVPAPTRCAAAPSGTQAAKEASWTFA